jgi:hypothetical protein
MLDDAVPFIILIIIGAYVFGLLYLNAKAKPGRNRIPENLKPLKYAVNSVGVMFIAILLIILLIVVGVLLWCLLSDCPRIE